jgi:hypothetical protein
MGWMGKALGAVLWLGVGLAPVLAQAALPDFGKYDASAQVRQRAKWVLQSGDHRGRPFAIVDKKHARLYVFDGRGRLAGASAALVGQAIGDRSAPLVGEHTSRGYVPVHERTTPAGRFISEPGRNLTGEHVVWVDYDAAFAIHQLRPGASRRAREARLASATPQDNRASLGCVVVPAGFYAKVVRRLLGRSRGVVYVLPEKRVA